MIEEIKELIEADKAKEKAYSECEVDASYFCYKEAERLEEAEKALEAKIIELIDSRIKEAERWK